jgi:hypothetical protein
VNLTFTPFGLTALEHYARSEGMTMAVVVSHAAAYLAADLESGRPELKALSVEHPGVPRSVELELDLSPSACGALESEAKRQGIPWEELLEFATVYYLADIESGAAAERILRRSEEAP